MVDMELRRMNWSRNPPLSLVHWHTHRDKPLSVTVMSVFYSGHLLQKKSTVLTSISE